MNASELPSQLQLEIQRVEDQYLDGLISEQERDVMITYLREECLTPTTDSSASQVTNINKENLDS